MTEKVRVQKTDQNFKNKKIQSHWYHYQSNEIMKNIFCIKSIETSRYIEIVIAMPEKKKNKSKTTISTNFWKKRVSRPLKSYPIN